MSAPSSFIANAHNKLYAFYTGKDGLLQTLLSQNRGPHLDPPPNPNPNPTTKQHAVVNMQLNIVTCTMYPDKFTRDALLLHRLYYFRL